MEQRSRKTERNSELEGRDKKFAQAPANDCPDTAETTLLVSNKTKNSNAEKSAKQKNCNAEKTAMQTS